MRLHRQNMTHFLSLDERRAWRERSKGNMKERGQTQAKRLQIDKEFVQLGGQDFEQSQPNHGWPRVGLVYCLGTRCGSLVRSNIRSKSGPSSRLSTSSTRRHAWLAHHVPLGVTTTPDLQSPIPSRLSRSHEGRCRWIGPSHTLPLSGPSSPFNSDTPPFVHPLYVNRYTIGLG